MQIDPEIEGIEEPIPFLQISAERVGYVLLYTQWTPIEKRLVEQYLCSISKIFSSVGANNPHHNSMGKLDFRLGCHLESYQKEDYPPTIMWPLPVSFTQALDTATQRTNSRNIAIINLN